MQRTIHSLALTKYDAGSKLLFVIVDGVVTGAGNDKPTPDLVLEVLGHPGDEGPAGPAEPRAYEALGEGLQQLNFAKVYSGWYELQGQEIPYVVVVKCGNETETSKPGNRGGSWDVLVRCVVCWGAELP